MTRPRISWALRAALRCTTSAVAIIGIVLAIVWLKFPPVFALLFGTLYLGLTTPVGPEGTIEAISGGFADVMADIGILVTFGVIIGALLTVTNTMERIVEAMLRRFGERSMPYVFAVALCTLFTSMYSDVLLVLSSPLARRIGPKLGPRGRALMGGSLTAGIEVGLVFVAPGVAAVAIAGILDVPSRETGSDRTPAPEGAGTQVVTQIEVSPAPRRELSLLASIGTRSHPVRADPGPVRYQRHRQDSHRADDARLAHLIAHHLVARRVRLTVGITDR